MTVSLIIGDRQHAGWTSATVTRSLETISGTFDIALSERSPGETTMRQISPGDQCAVFLDGEGVIRGYIDSVNVRVTADVHQIEVRGRDVTGDLVDCSAATTPGEFKNAGLAEIVAALTAPFGINVTVETDTGAPWRVAKFRIEEGETVFESIDRACRFRAVLPLSDGNGGLILGQPTRSRTQTRLRRGVNILAVDGTASLVDRFSDYKLQGQQAGQR